MQARWAAGVAKNKDISRACQDLENLIVEARKGQAFAEPSAEAAPSVSEAVPAASATGSSAAQPFQEAEPVPEEEPSREIDMPDAEALTSDEPASTSGAEEPSEQGVVAVAAGQDI